MIELKQEIVDLRRKQGEPDPSMIWKIPFALVTAKPGTFLTLPGFAPRAGEPSLYCCSAG